jgi:hypothetical protein
MRNDGLRFLTKASWLPFYKLSLVGNLFFSDVKLAGSTFPFHGSFLVLYTLPCDVVLQDFLSYLS